MTPTTDPLSPPNFVVRRKRKRHAIDPCLGYYDALPPDPPTAIAKPKSSTEISVLRNSPRSSESQQHNDIPPIEVLNEVLGSADDALPDLQSPPNTVVPVTVEAFLQAGHGRQKMKIRDGGRRKVQKPPRQGQSASCGDELPDDNPRPPKRRHHRICPSSPPPDDGPSVDQLFNDESPKQRPAKSKRKAPLAQRLLQAAISSNVNPVDSLVHDADRSVTENRSLSFITTKTESSSGQRLWTLTDPHKKVFFDKTTFVARHHSTSEPKPLTRWPTHCQDAERRKLPRKKGIKNQIDQVKGIQRNPNICKPLSFVPLCEAENSYAARKDAPKKAAKEKDPPNSTSIKPMPLPLVQVPSTTKAKSSPGSQSPTHVTNTSSPSPIQPAPAKTRDIDLILHASQVNSRSSLFPALQPNASSPFSLLTIARSPSQCINPEQELNSANLVHLPDIDITTADKKIPKPLSSFLDQFLETAKIAQSQAHPTTHPRNHTHTKCPPRIRKPTQLPNTPPVEYAPVETNLVEVMFAGGSESPYFEPQSSPDFDLVTALRPSQYQVHLSSSPIREPRRPVSVRRSMAGLRAFYAS